MSNIHNRTLKSGILFKDNCIGDFFDRIDFINCRVEAVFHFLSKNCTEAQIGVIASEGTEGILAERREAAFTCIIVNNA